MPKRKPSSGPASSPTIDPDVQVILSGFDRLPTLTEPHERASLYEDLGNCYCNLNMYARCIQMFGKSLDEAIVAAGDTEPIRGKLAEFIIHLLGEAGFDKARTVIEGCSSEFIIERLIKAKRAAIDRHTRREEMDRQYSALKSIVGESQHTLEVCAQITKYANTSLSVLITGPSGSGKELVARALHDLSNRRQDLSNRRQKPLIVTNCAEGPESLIESRLFGHKKGAFTGAVVDQKGLIEAARGGTLFLDEIGELPISLQPKLLRILETREFYRLGDVNSRRVKVRYIAATNRDLLKMVKEERFREDLYSRLRGVEITLKPLEDRLEDLPLLARHFIQEHGVATEHAAFSPYDILKWVEADYLFYQLSHKATNWSIWDLRNVILRAQAEGRLQHRGDYPIVDRLEARVQNAPKEGIGSTLYTLTQLENYDLQIAQERCSRQRDVAKLLGKSETWVSRRKASKDTPRENTSRARPRPDT
jgi:transcriptional regulator with GAF, ATPase, and Fis domain